MYNVFVCAERNVLVCVGNLTVHCFDNDWAQHKIICFDGIRDKPIDDDDAVEDDSDQNDPIQLKWASTNVYARKKWSRLKIDEFVVIIQLVTCWAASVSLHRAPLLVFIVNSNFFRYSFNGRWLNGKCVCVCVYAVCARKQETNERLANICLWESWVTFFGYTKTRSFHIKIK